MIGWQGWRSRRGRQSAGRQWAALANSAMQGRRAPDPDLRDEALALHADLRRFLQHSDASPSRARDDLQLLALPPGTDWRWRPMTLRGRIVPAALVAPENGQRFSDEVVLWHDCGHRAAILRQVRNRQGTDLAHYGLSLEVMGFSGGYLSLSLDLPDAMQEDLGRDHVLRVDAQLSAERAMTVYGRINIAQGPDTASKLRQLDHPIEGRNNPRVVEFDLAYADLAGRPADKVWLDLIFEAPAMNAVTLTDLVMSRHPRAQI